MKQRIVVALPPVYEECIKAFGAENIVGRMILWSWGPVIYNPLDIDIPRELLAHEGAHGAQQGTDEAEIRRWWDKYLVDPQFRFEEELLGHRAEWFDYVRRHPGKNCASVLEAIAGRLASPLYGRVVELNEARARILG